jgi:hypothetical protein
MPLLPDTCRRARYRSSRRLVLLAPWLFLAFGGAGLAHEGQAAAAGRERPEPAVYKIGRADSAIVVDGVLDEAAWGSALTLRLEYETRPAENSAPPVETECLVAYDDDRFYVGFRAFDPDPGSIRAHLQDRDTIFGDDMVGFKLDPFNDERRAFQFFVNALGVQFDSLEDDVSGNEDHSWDVIWSSRGRITDEGYVVEIAVPFHQLRFPKGGGTQTWGFDAVRFYPRSQTHRIALQPVDRDIQCQLCQMSKVRGLEGITPGRNIELVPTVTSGRTDQRDDFPDGPLTEGSVDSELGFTGRWGMTPNLTLNVALNPDFSQVEADSAQLDVNNRFALFFEEKRPFFLEGADFFSTPLDVVFTRNVADPSWGGKVTGKQGPHAMGVFVARDQLTNLIFPGSTGSEGTSLDLESTDAVVRYRRDFGESSALGVLVTSREGDGYSNRVAGIDGLWRLGESDSIRFQSLTSQTEYPLDVALEFDQPAGSFSGRAHRIDYSHNAREWDWSARYVDVGSDFRADMGFMPRGDYRFVSGDISRTWWGDDEDWFTEIRVSGDWDRTEDQAGQMLEEEVEVDFDITGPMQSRLSVGVGTSDEFFDGVTFDNLSSYRTWVEVRPSGKFWLGMFTGYDDAIDFANTRAGTRFRWEPSIRLNVGLRLRLTLDHDLQEFEVDEGTLFEANLTQLRLVYQFNVRTFFRTIVQYRDVERDPSLYEEAVEAMTERLFTQFLFSYKLNPQTVLFLGYADNREGDEIIDLTERNRTLFFKFGYAFVL